MVGVGFSMLFASKQERTKQYGAMLMGLGLVFFGMSVMSDAIQEEASEDFATSVEENAVRRVDAGVVEIAAEEGAQKQNLYDQKTARARL